jgi:hypothetical protein
MFSFFFVFGSLFRLHMDILRKYNQRPEEGKAVSLKDVTDAERATLLSELNSAIASLKVGDEVAHATLPEEEHEKKDRESRFWVIYKIDAIERGMDRNGDPEIILKYEGEDEGPYVYHAIRTELNTDEIVYIPLNMVNHDLKLLRTMIHIILGFPAAILIQKAPSN